MRQRPSLQVPRRRPGKPRLPILPRSPPGDGTPPKLIDRTSVNIHVDAAMLVGIILLTLCLMIALLLTASGYLVLAGHYSSDPSKIDVEIKRPRQADPSDSSRPGPDAS